MRGRRRLAACDAALKVDPGYLDAHQLRIEVLRKLKRHDEVIRSCDALLTRGRPSSELYEFRGLAKEKLRNYEGAIEDQTLAIALDPGAASLLAKRGALYLVSDAPRSALSDFERAIRIDSTNADAHLGRGLALAALGRHREAVNDAAKALGMAEPTATRLYNAARIHAQAAIVAASEARKTGWAAVSLVNHYQDQAMEFGAPVAEADSPRRASQSASRPASGPGHGPPPPPPAVVGADRGRVLVGWLKSTNRTILFDINSRSTRDGHGMELHQQLTSFRSSAPPPPTGGKLQQHPLPAPIRAGGRPDVALDLQRDEHG